MEILLHGRGKQCFGKATWEVHGRRAQRHVSQVGVWEAWKTTLPTYKIEIMLSENFVRIK